MNGILRTMTILGCLVMNQVAFSDKILIAVKPIGLVYEKGYYTIPKQYTERLGNFFVKIATIDRVCFPKEHPELAALDVVQVVIEDKGIKRLWHCYQYSPEYFQSIY